MAQTKHAFFLACVALLIAGLAASGGCGSSSGSNYNGLDLSGTSSGPGGSNGGGGSLSLDGGPFGQMATCANDQGWSCMVDKSCSTPTKLTGKVYDPAGRNPLYNVVVFIPNDPKTLPPITPGTHTCNTCDVSIGNYVTATTTDSTGSSRSPACPPAATSR